jgi:HEAT repeat protein
VPAETPVEASHPAPAEARHPAPAEAPIEASQPAPAEVPVEANRRARAGKRRESAPAPEPGPSRESEEPSPEVEPSDARGAELEHLLRELEDCEDGARYAKVAHRLVLVAVQLAEDERLDDSYRVVLELARHASDEAKRPAGQVELAVEYLSSLAKGDRLLDLIDRACAPGAEESVRATQVLLQLGEEVASPLLEAAEREPDPGRRGRLHGILIAMGEKTLPTLLEAMKDSEPERAQRAIRIAGESQNPGAVPRLAEILVGERAVLREEAGRALVLIGNASALEALMSVLDSEIEGLPALAAYCLAASASPYAVGPLLRAMREAIDSGEIEAAREAIRALGRLARPEASGALAELLLSKSLRRRRRLRELKVAAATALGRIPGDEAVGALAQAARSRDGQLRRAAQTALDRRAEAFAGD